MARQRLSCFLLILISWMITMGRSYRSIDEYYFNIGKDENLYDTGILPDSEDVTIYLFHNEPQSFFFPTEGQSSPTSITVVPCSSEIEWKVYFHAHSPDKQDSFEGDPLFLQEAKTTGINGAVNRHLHTFRGRDMATFNAKGQLPKGILRVTITATESNSKVKLYASSVRQNELAIPSLPETPGVDIVANDKTSVTVAWKPSPSYKQWGQHIKYCVAFNPRHNYGTLCALHADLEGEPPPPWPRHAGFGFRWEDVTKMRILSIRKQKKHKLRRDIHLDCVGSRHWASATSLLPGRQYFVDVFAINEMTNRSVTYTGATFITPGRPPMPKLTAGVLTTAFVGGSLGPQVTYEHEMYLYAKKFVLFLQTCSSHISVDVIYEGAVAIRAKPVTDFQKVILKNIEPGNYSVRLTINSEDNAKAAVKMCLAGKLRRCPYVGVPIRRVINATKNVSSCRSVTLQWPSADSHAKYCIYKIKLPDDYEPLLAEYNQCPILTTDKPVFCRQYKKGSPQRNGKTIVETIWGLKMKTKYEFQLQAILRQGVTVDYEPVYVDMDEQC